MGNPSDMEGLSSLIYCVWRTFIPVLLQQRRPKATLTNERSPRDIDGSCNRAISSSNTLACFGFWTSDLRKKKKKRNIQMVQFRFHATTFALLTQIDEVSHAGDGSFSFPFRFQLGENKMKYPFSFRMRHNLNQPHRRLALVTPSTKQSFAFTENG